MPLTQVIVIQVVIVALLMQVAEGWWWLRHQGRVVIVMPSMQGGRGHTVDAGGRVIVTWLTEWQVVVIVVQVVMVTPLTQVAKGWW